VAGCDSPSSAQTEDTVWLEAEFWPGGMLLRLHGCSLVGCRKVLKRGIFVDGNVLCLGNRKRKVATYPGAGCVSLGPFYIRVFAVREIANEIRSTNIKMVKGGDE
jgi:hypothetical protein